LLFFFLVFDRFFMKRWLATAAARRAVAPASVSWPEEFIKGGMGEGILFKAKENKTP
jgi:hypothetical protein